MARMKSAMEIIDNVPPITAQAFKLALTEALERSLEDGVRLAERAQRVVRETRDHNEALRAYSEKRKPIWRGC